MRAMGEIELELRGILSATLLARLGRRSVGIFSTRSLTRRVLVVGHGLDDGESGVGWARLVFGNSVRVLLADLYTVLGLGEVISLSDS